MPTTVRTAGGFPRPAAYFALGVSDGLDDTAQTGPPASQGDPWCTPTPPVRVKDACGPRGLQRGALAGERSTFARFPFHRSAIRRLVPEVGELRGEQSTQDLRRQGVEFDLHQAAMP